MIYLESDVQNSHSIRNAVVNPLPQLLRMFLIFLQEKNVKHSVLPKEIESMRAFVSVHVQSGPKGYPSNILCRIGARWTSPQKILNISIQITVSGLAGQQMVDFPLRTRRELPTAVAEINKYLLEQCCGLTLSYHSDAFHFRASTDFSASQPQQKMKKTAFKMIERSWEAFTKYFGQLEDEEFLKQQAKLKQVITLRQLLKRFYVDKTDSIIKSELHHQNNINSCMSLLLKKTRQHNQAFSSLAKANKFMQTQNCISEEPKQQKIAQAISIKRKEQPNMSVQQKLQQNLKINQAVIKNPEIISLNKVTFQLKRSFGSLRQNHQKEITYYSHFPQSQNQQQEHLILKKCAFFNDSQTETQKNGSSQQSDSTASQSIPKKSQHQSGHQNEHNFLMLNGNLKCPYIGQYYLDVGQSSIKTISKRTIMTLFEPGDLFTEVAYRTYKNLYQYTLMEYLTMFWQLAKAIKFLHENKIIHRDLKPTNVLFKYYYRNNLECKIIDFGSCYILQEKLQHLFNQRIFTTPDFNLTFKQAKKLTNDSICRQFTRNQYESHQLFDIYGIAATIEYLLQNSPFWKSLDCLKTVISICKDPNPYLRFTPQELLTVIENMRQTEAMNEKARLGRMVRFQFN